MEITSWLDITYILTIGKLTSLFSLDKIDRNMCQRCTLDKMHRFIHVVKTKPYNLSHMYLFLPHTEKQYSSPSTWFRQRLFLLFLLNHLHPLLFPLKREIANLHLRSIVGHGPILVNLFFIAVTIAVWSLSPIRSWVSEISSCNSYNSYFVVPK